VALWIIFTEKTSQHHHRENCFYQGDTIASYFLAAPIVFTMSWTLLVSLQKGWAVRLIQLERPLN